MTEYHGPMYPPASRTKINKGHRVSRTGPDGTTVGGTVTGFGSQGAWIVNWDAPIGSDHSPA